MGGFMLSNRKMGWFIVIGMVMLLALPGFACKKAAPETLSETLARAANVTLVKYDMVMTSPQGTQTTKVWVKGNMWRIELPWFGQTVSAVEPPRQGGTVETARNQGYLIDTSANIVYALYSQYSSTPEKYGVYIEKSPLIHPGEVIGPGTPGSWAKMIAMSDPKVVGTETVEGKASVVVEYVPGQISGVQGQIRGKAWIWKEHPLLVRIETTIGERTASVEFKNIEFADIPDSVFEPREALRSLLDKMSLPSRIE